MGSLRTPQSLRKGAQPGSAPRGAKELSSDPVKLKSLTLSLMSKAWLSRGRGGGTGCPGGARAGSRALPVGSKPLGSVLGSRCDPGWELESLAREGGSQERGEGDVCCSLSYLGHGCASLSSSSLPPARALSPPEGTAAPVPRPCYTITTFSTSPCLLTAKETVPLGAHTATHVPDPVTA